jgi:dolichol-phosphate mannosyltransferase
MADVINTARERALTAGSPRDTAICEITVILPTYNERPNIAPIVARLDAALADVNWEAIFVDDNSPDDTADAVRSISAHDSRIRCMRRVNRRGLAGACLEGALAARSEFVAIMDADLQHDERILVKMLQILRGGEADIVVATRYSAEGSAAGFGTVRRMISRGATALGKSLLSVRASDPMSGFFATRRTVFDKLAPEITTDGFKLLFDILATRQIALRLAEVPYTFRVREYGESKLDSRVAIDFMGLVFARFSRNLLPHRFLMFCIVGVSGVGVHLLILSILVRFKMTFTVAQTLATLVAIASNFWLNNLITYSDQTLRGWSAVRGAIIFFAVCIFGFIGNISIATWIFESNAKWWIAGLTGAIMSAVWNYAVSSTFVWRYR